MTPVHRPRLVALAILAGLLCAPVSAMAQNDPVSGLFKMLFGGGQQQQPPANVGPGGQLLPPGAAPPGTVRTRPPEPRIVEQPKDADARIVTVVGDSQAAGLAAGLQAAFADAPGIAVSRRTRASSSLVREDGINWVEQLPTVLSEGKNDYIVMMLGLNDRQTFPLAPTATGKADDIRSAKWEETYRDRLGRIMKTLRDTGKPIYWVGQAPVERPTLNGFLEYLNGVQKSVAEANHIPFIEVWNGFTDDEGAYTAFGPDVDGNEKRLRSDDGFSFTRTGQRKLAYFVEQEIRGAVRDGPVAEPVMPEAPVAPIPKEEAMLAAPPPLPPAPWKRVGPVVTLGDKGLTGETELLGAPPAPPPSQALPTASNRPPVPGQPAIVRPVEPPKPVEAKKAPDVLPGGYPIAETPYARRVLRGEEIERPVGRADDFRYNRVSDQRGG